MNRNRVLTAAALLLIAAALTGGCSQGTTPQSDAQQRKLFAASGPMPADVQAKMEAARAAAAKKYAAQMPAQPQ